MVALGTVLVPAPAGAAATRVHAPLVGPADFPTEPIGAVPVDGNGLIPNAVTPTGVRPGPPRTCGVVFDAAAGATATSVNAEIARVENRLTKPLVVCLAGTFTRPIRVWGKHSRPLLELAPAPGHAAVIDPGAVRPADVSPHDHTGGVAGGVSITGSRDVEVEGLTITGYHSRGPAFTPAGILVEVRRDGGYTSPCFEHGDHACSGIYLIDDTVDEIANLADSVSSTRRYCGTSGVGAYGIGVFSYGRGAAGALQHVVVEGDTIDHTRTGQSETLTVNGDVTDFLVADNLVSDTDNIGIDTIGWEAGTDQARHGIVSGNVVANVDTWSNHSYGRWNGSRCVPRTQNAGGIYDDGASYVWIEHNTVWNTNQGISLDVETPRRTTGHLLVTGNTVFDGPGTSIGTNSAGTDPSQMPGVSSVAGHAYDAFYVDAFGVGSTIADVVATGNTFVNESQFYGTRSPQTAPVVDLGGRWRTVVIRGDVIEGNGASDRRNPLLLVDNEPLPASIAVVDCNAYGRLSAEPTGNFVLPGGKVFVSLSAWRRGNGHGWDAHSVAGLSPPRCPPPP